MNEKLCIFCQHFSWTAEEMAGQGSDQTGPMMEGGWAECHKGQFKELEAPHDEVDYRRVIMIGQTCPHFEQVKT